MSFRVCPIIIAIRYYDQAGGRDLMNARERFLAVMGFERARSYSSLGDGLLDGDH